MEIITMPCNNGKEINIQFIIPKASDKLWRVYSKDAEPDEHGQYYLNHRVKCYDLVMDYLNKDYLSMAGKLYGIVNEDTINPKSADDLCPEDLGGDETPEEIDYVIKLMKSELDEIDYNKLLVFVEKVFINRKGLSSNQRFMEYYYKYGQNINYYELSFNARQSVSTSIQFGRYRRIDNSYELSLNTRQSLNTIIQSRSKRTVSIEKSEPLEERKKKNSRRRDFHEETKDVDINIISQYDFSHMKDILDYLLFEMVKCSYAIKVCPNCHKFFVPARSDAQYCNNVFCDDGKTCSEYRAYINYRSKIRLDEPKKLHHKIYNMKRNRLERDYSTRRKKREEDLNEFVKESNNRKDRVKSGIDTAEDYVIWLNEQYDKAKQKTDIVWVDE